MCKCVNGTWEKIDNSHFGTVNICGGRGRYHGSYGFVIAALVMLVIRELYQFSHGPREYITSKTNILEVAIIIMVITYQVIAGGNSENWDALPHVGAWCALLISLELMLLLENYFSIDDYTGIAQQLAATCVKILLMYLPIFCGFAVAFALILTDPNKVFDHPLNAFLRVLTMMMGEFDYTDNFTQDHATWAGLSTNIIFTIFWVAVAIVFLNMLLGFIVHQMEAMQTEVDFLAVKSQVEQITSLHGYRQTLSTIWRFCSSKCSSRQLCLHRVLVNKYYPYRASPILEFSVSLFASFQQAITRSKKMFGNCEISKTKLCFQPSAQPAYLYLYNETTKTAGIKTAFVLQKRHTNKALGFLKNRTMNTTANIEKEVKEGIERSAEKREKKESLNSTFC